jgi:PBP1b-binding outer membrane lipoprotein LpoB
MRVNIPKNSGDFMKKLSLVLCLIALVVLLSSCGSDTAPDSTESSSTTEAVNENVIIEIEKLNIADEATFSDDLKAYGAEITDSEDGGKLVCEFTDSEYKILVQDKREATVKAFEDLENDTESYVEKVEYDDDFRNLKIYVNKEAYDSKASASAFGNTFNDYAIAAKAVAYQTYLKDGQSTITEIYYTDGEEPISVFPLPAEKDVF